MLYRGKFINNCCTFGTVRAPQKVWLYMQYCKDPESKPLIKMVNIGRSFTSARRIRGHNPSPSSGPLQHSTVYSIAYLTGTNTVDSAGYPFVCSFLVYFREHI